MRGGDGPFADATVGWVSLDLKLEVHEYDGGGGAKHFQSRPKLQPAVIGFSLLVQQTCALYEPYIVNLPASLAGTQQLRPSELIPNQCSSAETSVIIFGLTMGVVHSPTNHHEITRRMHNAPRTRPAA
jgi:hypothetical protein